MSLGTPLFGTRFTRMRRSARRLFPLWVATYLSMITVAYSGPTEGVLCWILTDILWGDLGKASATVGVLAVAAAAVMGRVSWSIATTVAIGISLLFGAGYVVKAALNLSSSSPLLPACL